MNATPKKTALVPLLYWLMVIAGLAGFTMKRIGGDTRELVPIWTGTILGVVLGQALALRRVRAWMPITVMLGCCWLAPVFYVALYEVFGGVAGTCVLAFVPAAVCAYLSLSERSGLVSFWYPAVLWMLVVFDGASPNALELRRALPIFVALTALFAWFLRARESRRAQIWLEHANERLAKPVATNVLRSSPLRAGAGIAWTGFAGAGALVLAAWVAPHLLLTDKTGSHATRVAGAGTSVGAGGAGKPCCPAKTSTSESERTREYFSILSSGDGHDMHESDEASSVCQVCSGTTGTAVASDGDGDGAYFARTGWYHGAPGGTFAGAGELTGLPGSAYDGASLGAGYDPYDIHGTTTATPSTWEPVVQPAVPTPLPQVTAAPVAIAPPPIAKPAPASPTSHKPSTIGHGSVGAGPAMPFDGEVASSHASSLPVDWPSPFRTALVLVLAFVSFRFFGRIARRRIVLRHLAHPYWNESLDQRISNHWQRMLIGLRDAGIAPKSGEQPLVFARRIGIEGAATCATILERARHGVRVDESDEATMATAANAVYDTARGRAGIAGRAAGALRWPLA